jgi:hypothetical protein
MIAPELWSEITPEDLAASPDMRLICENLGPETLMRLMELIGKTYLYLGENNLMPFKERFIMQNKTRYTPKEFARKLGLSENRVLSTLREHGGVHDPKQMDIFASSQST